MPRHCWLLRYVQFAGGAFSIRVPEEHYRDVHPEYHHWNAPFQRRLSLLAAIPLLLYPVLLVLAFTSGLPPWLFYVWVATIAPPFLGLFVWLQTTRRYRREWRKVHPVDPRYPGYRPSRFVVKSALISFLGLISVTLGLFLRSELYSILLFFGGALLLSAGLVLTIYGRFFRKPS